MMKKKSYNYGQLCTRNRDCSRLIIVVVSLLFVACYDFNLFRVWQDIDKRLSEVDGSDFFLILEDKDVIYYLKNNKPVRDKYINKYIEKVEKNVADDGKVEDRVIYYFNAIRLLSLTTEIADISINFFTIYKTLTSKKVALNDLTDFATILYEKIKGKEKSYVTNFITDAIRLQDILSLLGKEFSEDNDGFPTTKDESQENNGTQRVRCHRLIPTIDGFQENCGSFAEIAILSSLLDFFYRFHRVIEIDKDKEEVKKVKKTNICKGVEAEGCEIVEEEEGDKDKDKDDEDKDEDKDDEDKDKDKDKEYRDDYKEVLIHFLIEDEGYEDIFTLDVEDFTHVGFTDVPGTDIEEFIFKDSFLYDNFNSNPPENFVDKVIEAVGFKKLADDIKNRNK